MCAEAGVGPKMEGVRQREEEIAVRLRATVCSPCAARGGSGGGESDELAEGAGGPASAPARGLGRAVRGQRAGETRGGQAGRGGQGEVGWPGRAWRQLPLKFTSDPNWWPAAELSATGHPGQRPLPPCGQERGPQPPWHRAHTSSGSH